MSDLRSRLQEQVRKALWEGDDLVQCVMRALAPDHEEIREQVAGLLQAFHHEVTEAEMAPTGAVMYLGHADWFLACLGLERVGWWGEANGFTPTRTLPEPAHVSDFMRERGDRPAFVSRGW